MQLFVGLQTGMKHSLKGIHILIARPFIIRIIMIKEVQNHQWHQINAAVEQLPAKVNLQDLQCNHDRQREKNHVNKPTGKFLFMCKNKDKYDHSTNGADNI